jgi:acetyl-CoA synthetase
MTRRLALAVSARADPQRFWLDQAHRLEWVKPPTVAGDWSFAESDFHIRWFADGVLNASVSCIDRHLATRGEQTAIIFEPDEPEDHALAITFAELAVEVARFANVLKAAGVKKGDRVTLYLPMIPAAAYAMLACARIGAVHSVVFGGFSPEALAGRLSDCGSRVVVTADQGRRGGKRVPLKANVDRAAELTAIDTVIVVQATGGNVTMHPGRDIWFHDVVATVPDTCAPEPMSAEDPLFILYTSGSTGKPKGVVHTTAGYLLWAALTHEWCFDHRSGDVFWCTADIGWVTGHSYVVYGPLANGGTTVLFEGVPHHPDPSRFWQICDRHRVATIFTAPTALRALMREGDHWVSQTRRSSLRTLGTVGEPINPEAWRWYHEVVGEGRCPIIDTWWQTETGAALIAPSPGMRLKPGSAALPLPGIEPVIMDEHGGIAVGEASGHLVLASSWPGQMRTVWGDDRRFFETYFSTYPGTYFTGDGARRDQDGYWWITGRVDDVVNVSGHRLGTAEVESALVAHPKVAEAAVVGIPHEIKGQGIFAFVTLIVGEEGSVELRRDLIAWVRREIGPIAAPDFVQFAPRLPKTRSGKIMRRVLRKVTENDTGALGDISTLADPSVVEELIRGAQALLPMRG